MNGTTTVETAAMRLRPPITTSPTQTVTSRPARTTGSEYVVPKSCTPVAMFAGSKPGSKKRCTADVMPWICVIVPMPMMPASVPNTAKSTASHFQLFRPKRPLRPRSM